MKWYGKFCNALVSCFSVLTGRGAPPDKLNFGKRGEKIALKHLRKKGYRLLRKNYRAGGGEIDLIMQDGRTVVFVEVKTRRREDFAGGEAAVNFTKQKHLTAAARQFIQKHHLHNHPLRFDVLAIGLPTGARPDIRHWINAFQPKY